MISVTTKMFLDRWKVVAAMDKKRRTVLFKVGGFTRSVMQRSMRYSTRPSRPGQPPHARRNNPLLRKLTYFGYDEATESMAVGPTLFKSSGSRPAGGKSVPELINEGGIAELQLLKPTGDVRADYAPRPFVPPAKDQGLEFMNNQLESVPLR